MTKKEKLEKLDTLLLDKMIDIMDGKEEMGLLKDLSTPMNYLRNNSVVADKTKSTIEKDTKKRLAEAKERRRKNESK